MLKLILQENFLSVHKLRLLLELQKITEAQQSRSMRLLHIHQMEKKIQELSFQMEMQNTLKRLQKIFLINFITLGSRLRILWVLVFLVNLQL